MILTRQAARFARGWPSDKVQAAGEKAADELAGAVQPFARAIIDDHRGAGRSLVLATTTPDDRSRPLAERRSLKEMLAARMTPIREALAPSPAEIIRGDRDRR